jgi:hypothetical protein
VNEEEGSYSFTEMGKILGEGSFHMEWKPNFTFGHLKFKMPSKDIQ